MRDAGKPFGDIARTDRLTLAAIHRAQSYFSFARNSGLIGLLGCATLLVMAGDGNSNEPYGLHPVSWFIVFGAVLISVFSGLAHHAGKDCYNGHEPRIRALTAITLLNLVVLSLPIALGMLLSGGMGLSAMANGYGGGIIYVLLAGLGFLFFGSHVGVLIAAWQVRKSRPRSS